MIQKITTNNHEEWLELRSKYIGGSDAAAVVGLNPWCSPYSLWAEKTKRLPAFEGNLATEVGTWLEDFIAKKFEQVTGKKVRRVNQSFINDQYPWAIANIDRDVIGEDEGLECKSTSELNLKKYKNGEFPANYYVQCVHYLAVTGKKRWNLAVLIGNKEFKTFVIERDEDEIAALMGEEEEFFHYIETDTPPMIDGTKPTTEAISSVYPTSNGSSVDLFLCANNINQYLELSKQIKELEQQKDAIANNIKEFLKDAETGESALHKVSWKTVERSTFDSKTFAKDNPELDLSKYYKKSSCRTFKVTEK